MIVALDIATRTGVAVGSAGSAPRAWSEDLGKRLSEDERLSNVLRLTDRLIREHRPDIVAVEAPVGGRETSHFLVGLVACVRGCCSLRGVALASYHSGSVRKHFIGKALTARDFPSLKKAAAKAVIKDQVFQRCKLLGYGDLDADAADAAALWDYACAMSGAQVPPAGGLFA